VEFLQSDGESINDILKDSILFGGRDAVQRSIYLNQQSVFDYLMTLVDGGLLDLDFISDRGMTALHAAAFQSNNQWYIQALLQRGCNPYARSKDGSQPLIHALKFQNFGSARLIVESPYCDRNLFFSGVNHKGYTDCGSLVGMAMTNYRNIVNARTIEFLDSIGGTNYMNHLPTNSTLLHLVGSEWPSSRPDYANFESWITNWLVSRMPEELLNSYEMNGLAAIHCMVFRANVHGITTMLQSSKVNLNILTAPDAPDLPGRMTIFDIALDRCLLIPGPVLEGGARELHFFHDRMKRLVSLLLDTQIPCALPKYRDSPREALAEKALRKLREKVQYALISRAIEDQDVRIRWPQVIPISV